jgi:hypothetical protein
LHGIKVESKKAKFKSKNDSRFQMIVTRIFWGCGQVELCWAFVPAVHYKPVPHTWHPHKQGFPFPSGSHWAGKLYSAERTSDELNMCEQ